MAYASAPHTWDIDSLVREMLVPHANGHGGAPKRDEIKAVLTEALSEAIRRTLTQATPLERALFVESLGGALADSLSETLAAALAPALADSLAPALAESLGEIFAQSKRTTDSKSAASGKGAQDQGANGTEREREKK